MPMRRMGRRPVVVVPRRNPILRTAAIVGTAAVVGSAMSGGRNQQPQSTKTTIVVQQAPGTTPAPSAGPTHIYLLSNTKFYLTQCDKSLISLEHVDPQFSVWVEQHVGNGYYVLKSHTGRLLSEKNGKVKLAKLCNPVKQKCMFYREQIGNQCRFRSVGGYFIKVTKKAEVCAKTVPDEESLFSLQLVPVAPPAARAPQQPTGPAPPQNVQISSNPTRDASQYSSGTQQAPPHTYGIPPGQQQFGAPQQTQPQYGAPQTYGIPLQQQYGAPQAQYGAPQQQYGAPQAQYGAPQYVVSRDASQYSSGTQQAQQAPPHTYGIPPEQQQFGGPQQTQTQPQYGAPQQYAPSGSQPSYLQGL